MASVDFDPHLIPGDVLTHRQILDLFQCQAQSGIRASRTTNTLVVTTTPYADYPGRLIDGVLHFAGVGQEGDQRLSGKNKTLAESNTNGVAVHLFEVFVSNQATYRGRVVLAGEPYQERQLDKNGDERSVWVFPLRLADGAALPPLPAALLEEAAESRTREARRLSDEELKRRARLARKTPGQRIVTSTYYERNPHVAELSKRRAQGACQLCQQPAPFETRKGPFLETHHIIWLAKGGEDSIANTVALCPNCHRKVHSLHLASDLKLLKSRASC